MKILSVRNSSTIEPLGVNWSKMNVADKGFLFRLQLDVGPKNCLEVELDGCSYCTRCW